uniref:Dirigent protein n=1 Tax=Oryza punctata TaxID=4537 RepID=A0A0E0KIU4_ORYPU
MLGRIIFCVVIAAAILAVVLLATVSPLPGRHKGRGPDHPWTLTVYIHTTAAAVAAGTVSPPQRQQQEQGAGAASAFVFRHRMTAGPQSASRTVGAATGFVLPGEAGEVMSVFDTVHLAFDVAGMSGSVCVQAASVGGRGEGGDGKASRPTRRRGECGDPEVLRVVGGTGAFAFVAGGEAVLRALCAPRLFGGEATAKVLRLELSVAPAKS